MRASSHDKILERKWNSPIDVSIHNNNNNNNLWIRLFVNKNLFFFQIFTSVAGKQTRWHLKMRHSKMIYLLEVHTTIKLNNKQCEISHKNGSRFGLSASHMYANEKKDRERERDGKRLSMYFYVLQLGVFAAFTHIIVCVCFDWFSSCFTALQWHCVCVCTLKESSSLDSLLFTSADIERHINRHYLWCLLLLNGS